MHTPLCSRRHILRSSAFSLGNLAAAWLALNYLRQPESPVSTVEATTSEVVVAARDLPLGTVLTVEDVKLIDWPGEAVAEGYSSSVEEVLGRGVITHVSLNEPLISSKIAVKEAGGGLPIVIPEGSKDLHYEAEFVIVIGKRASKVSVASAPSTTRSTTSSRW